MFRKNIAVAFLTGALTVGVGTVAAQQLRATLFPDVSQSDYFFDAANRMSRLGIISGYESGRFGPNDAVTRGQAAVLLDRYDRKVSGALWTHVDRIRQELGLGSCGDAEMQSEEQCDDGNAINGDGCSEHCLLEQEFEQKCFSSLDCTANQFCSVEQGDCRYPCPPGVACIQACAGVCLPKPEVTQQALCGNAVCDAGEADEYRLEGGALVRAREGTCVQDCEGGESACQRQKNAIDVAIQGNMQCETDSDCTIFARACSPYQTCGKPIRKDAVITVTEMVLEYVDACGSTEPVLCAGCLPSTAVCQNGTCAMR